jgi:non-specific serine/threonine protein kinase/serine/threonine-protein kinase
MKAQEWQRIKGLLEVAIDLEGEAREKFLDRECGTNEELRAELQALLGSHQLAGTSFLEPPKTSLLDFAAFSPFPPGTRLGAYRISEEIGHGGMGEVYRAERADGHYDKQVAIKVVRAGFHTVFGAERFRNERQILAALDHPSIARLLDGGTTDDGMPYLAMELVDGEPIDQFCEQRLPSINDRLRLFRQVCAAVQFAHQRLVIHRDIKPSNILVTREGTPKLLDFGIAKILDPAARMETTLVHPMTPEYASPEQIRGEAITTASDVYSLGVLLYQLLTGRSPYGMRERGSHELAREICDVDPAKPSSAVLTDARSGEKARSSQLDKSLVRKRRKQLSGDLDDIVLKALRKESALRYASVEQFSEDIRRHMEGLPVAAVKGSFQYRAKKFAQRNKGLLIATAVVLLTVGVGILATVRQARIARRQAELADAERKRAESRFNDVRKLANSLIFEINDSIQDLPGATPSRKLLLDRAVEYLDKLSHDAAGDVDLQRELAWGYQRLSDVQGDTSQSNLGEINAAEASVNKSIALFEAVARANPTNIADQLNLAMAYRRKAFTDIFEPTGLAEIEKALAVTSPLIHSHPDNLEIQNERSLELQILANVQDATGSRLLAIETFRELVASREKLFRADPNFKNLRRGLAKSRVMLGDELGRFASTEEGLAFINQGMDELAQLVKEGGNLDVTRDYAASQTRRGQLQLRRGDYAAALADFRQARERTAPLAQRDPKNSMLQADLCDFDFEEGRALTASGQPAQGLPLSTRALSCYVSLKLEADTGPGGGALESWIAEAETGIGHPAEALRHLKSAENILGSDVAKYDDARCELAMVETKFGQAYLALGKLGDAADAFDKALSLAKLEEASQQHDIPALSAGANAYAGMGDLLVLKARKQPDPSRATLEQARKSYEKSLGVWRQIPYPSRINANGYAVADPQTIASRLHALPSE